MKHDLKITIILLIFFMLAQIAGLALINMDIKEISTADGVTNVVHEETSLGPRPEMSGLGAFAYVVIGIIVGTLLVLLIIKTNKINLWKVWFFLAVFVAMSLALGVFIKGWLVFIIALALALLKVLKPNVIVHNITEILMYAGLAIFLVPLLNVFWMIILLLAISIYDFIAVFKSKHMVKMAQFQTKSKLFAGLFIPYSKTKVETFDYSAKMNKTEEKIKIQLFSKSESSKPNMKSDTNIESKKISIQPSKLKLKKFEDEQKSAVLGGGDIAFPLMFTGCVMEGLIIHGMSKVAALYQSLIVTAVTVVALALLFIFAKKDKFYPAMPIITAGCIVGYLIVILI